MDSKEGAAYQCRARSRILRKGGGGIAPGKDCDWQKREAPEGSGGPRPKEFENPCL